MHFYLLASFRHNLPTFIFFTVPDKTRIPASIKENIVSWAKLNPTYKIVIHDDSDSAQLASLLAPRIYARWQELLPVQRADLHRYLVTAFFGGIYGDADTVCKRPISQWGQHSDDSFIGGVEAQNVHIGSGLRHEGARTVQLAQYAFASAAFQPLLLDLLESATAKIENAVVAEDRDTTAVGRLRSVLSSTGWLS